MDFIVCLLLIFSLYYYYYHSITIIIILFQDTDQAILTTEANLLKLSRKAYT